MTSGSSLWRTRLKRIAQRTPAYESNMGEGVSQAQDIVRLSANENIFLNLQILRDIMVKAVNNSDPRRYSVEAIDALENLLSKEHNITPEQVLIGNGGDQLIDLLVRYIARPGSKVVSVGPTFAMYRRYVLANNTTYREAPLRSDFALDLGTLLAEIDSTCQLVFLCSPNNPTAVSFDSTDIEKLLEETNSLVVIDEAYAAFAGTSLVKLTESYENLVILRTFSKSSGLAGLRLGYVVGQENLISTVKHSMQHPFPVSSLAADIASRVISQKALVNNTIRCVVMERKCLISKLNALSTVKAFNSETNFVLFKTKQSSRDVTAGLARRGILVRDIGHILDHENCIRVTIGPRPVMNRFVSALKEVLA
ncbi:MAG: histidinol-phosphate transaminase [Candidatus Thorarchaeota archaeon]